MKTTENSHFCEPNYGKHVERDNFLRILHRIAKNLLRRGHGKDLVQLTPLHTIGQEGETH